MEITAKIIKGIKYNPLFRETLKEFSADEFDINKRFSACLLKSNDSVFALSKWVSPKRTRSYPYERVYNTLIPNMMRITIIPLIKDEGINGDRDHLKWDTISLMSLLNVYVIIGYYNDAILHKTREGKITEQKFDCSHINEKIKELMSYHSSALHWNLKEASNDNIAYLTNKSCQSYRDIGKKNNVLMHNFEYYERKSRELLNDTNSFKNTSRELSHKAQIREVSTLQPKEILLSDTKASITIKNFLGGEYHFTVDETKIEKDILFLIESKHSKNSILPSASDIKDGLIKMMLYSNLENVEIDKINYKYKAVLQITSDKINGFLSSEQNDEEIKIFYQNNIFTAQNIKTIEILFA
ncbi:MAG: hypothetical protein WCJ33_09175, partial [Pseudomonadota bacterium]